MSESVGALSPLPTGTAAARIADRFVTAIALGQFVPEQRLPTVQQLAGMLEVSPTTVREALARLAALGYVVVRRGRTGGTFVTDHWGPESDAMVRRTLEPQWTRLQTLLDFRRIIEQQIARTVPAKMCAGSSSPCAPTPRPVPTASRPGWPTATCITRSPWPPTTRTWSI